MQNLTKLPRQGRSLSVTVDWVIMTAAVVALVGAAYTSIEGNVTSLSDSVRTDVATAGGGR
ncbi:hypothetical protein [Chachezhania antarctica]|uniref:hypothetical protein n=1 Tax=Chachezhania antarctica TaxID=2340860 RepID=UPI000EB5212A|nr:hypothetical protein [Chachezhania antarctica]|tara:strand:+ start:1621 stop:1803 length:183 start_codon:yes stop_codon:yes gene_type:complete